MKDDHVTEAMRVCIAALCTLNEAERAAALRWIATYPYRPAAKRKPGRPRQGRGT